MIGGQSIRHPMLYDNRGSQYTGPFSRLIPRFQRDESPWDWVHRIERYNLILQHTPNSPSPNRRTGLYEVITGHNQSILKLNYYNNTGVPSKSFQSCLANQKQTVFIKGISIYYPSTTFKFLVICMDVNLTWSAQIDYISMRLWRVIF